MTYFESLLVVLQHGYYSTHASKKKPTTLQANQYGLSPFQLEYQLAFSYFFLLMHAIASIWKRQAGIGKRGETYNMILLSANLPFGPFPNIAIMHAQSHIATATSWMKMSKIRTLVYKLQQRGPFILGFLQAQVVL